MASRSLRTSEIYEMIDWRLIILIACMISFGLAMEKTGADVYLAGFIISATAHYGPTAVLAGFFIMTVALTQPMSNQAAAIVVLPLALETAFAALYTNLVEPGLLPRRTRIAAAYLGLLLNIPSSRACSVSGVSRFTTTRSLPAMAAS